MNFKVEIYNKYILTVNMPASYILGAWTQYGRVGKFGLIIKDGLIEKILF